MALSACKRLALLHIKLRSALGYRQGLARLTDIVLAAEAADVRLEIHVWRSMWPELIALQRQKPWLDLVLEAHSCEAVT